MRVLVAEDEPDVRGVLLRLLRSLGHAPEGVADGGELLLRAASSAPDVVLSDIDLPVCSGLRAGLRLREELPGLPLVLMTGDPERAEEARRAGFARVLLKPFAVDELSSALTVF